MIRGKLRGTNSKNGKNGTLPVLVTRRVPIDSIAPHPRNTKYHSHPDSQIETLMQSAQTFGQYKNIVVWKGKIIAGAGIWAGMRRAGATKIEIKDVSYLSQTQAFALMTADNETQKFANTNESELAAIVQEVMDAEGAALARLAAGEQRALDALLAQHNKKEETADVGELVDRAAGLQKKWGTWAGQLWELGLHRLLIGDCTEDNDVGRLMQGDTAKASITDPPYNVGVKYTNKTNDSQPFDDYYAWCQKWIVHLPERKLMTVGIKRLMWWQTIIGDPQWIIAWVKRNGQGNTKLGGTNKWDAILCYACDPDGGIDVIEIQNDCSEGIKSQRSHPTAKPVELWTKLTERFTSPGDVVYEPFGGSGTTLISCQQTGRVCRSIEIEPKYAAVTLERWVSLTNQTPKLLG